MTNFDFLKAEPEFEGFADVAIAAEKILMHDYAASVLNCRRAMEFAIKWMYSVDKDLVMPWDDRLLSLMSTDEFRELVGNDLIVRMDFIRKKGNDVAHKRKNVSKDIALLCLENLYYVMDFVACCYSVKCEESSFNVSLIGHEKENTEAIAQEFEIRLDALIKENAALRDELTERREKQRQDYVPKPLEISEYKTRKLYIDSMLEDAGWIEGKNWLNEYKLKGMPNKSAEGYADYVLLGDDGSILAVIEAKRTCVDISKGSQQAKLYADLIEKEQGRRPVIFLTNGFKTTIIDNLYNERTVSAIYSKRDLEKLFNLQRMRSSLGYIKVDKSIVGRYYQEAAIKAVCQSFEAKKRNALLVMATGSGKTRTVIALCKVLFENGWIKNVLFLADRNSLVTQAKRSFVNLLPDISVTNLCEEKDNYNAHIVFSTYQTMIRCIDTVEDSEGKLFSCGHFDLVICDEAHRSIYNKYRDVIRYFDAPLVGLTATPKDEIDKNTYSEFQLEEGIPTYGYDLAQAVKDGFLVDYLSVETSMKFLQDGITYDELSEDEKRQHEDTVYDEEGNLIEHIEPSAINKWLFNRDTIKQVLDILMTNGLKIDYGNKLGKTIIFAKNHTHALEIQKVFQEEYPHLKGYTVVIDNYINYAQSAIDEFSEPGKLPQIAISVDMLDTGIDVPEVLNLVFFKTVKSKAKFWQMIGRGTRLCPNLIDGQDKSKFYIFDFCGNFEFFRMHKGNATPNVLSLQGMLFYLKAQIVYKLQDIKYQTDELIAFREGTVEYLSGKVQALNRKNFAVKRHLKYVELYRNPENYNTLTFADTQTMRVELSPLIEPDADDARALRFDALMYAIELAYLSGEQYRRGMSDLAQKAEHLEKHAGNIKDVKENEELIGKILHSDYLERAGINDFEHIRKKLRGLMQYIKMSQYCFKTDYHEEILSVEWKEAELENDDLTNYKAKAEFYVREHQDNEVIRKLKNNVPLTSADLDVLEQILWSEIGTQEDYVSEFGEKPLGEFVREIVGLEMSAAKAAFSDFLNETNLDSRQIYFVNQIVEYISVNGIMKDLSVLQESPFTDQGGVVELFSEEMITWSAILERIHSINANALVA